MPLEIKVGNVVELKKQHACGCKEFTVTRTGADVKFKCNNCSRVIMLDRETAEKRIKRIKKIKCLNEALDKLDT